MLVLTWLCSHCEPQSAINIYFSTIVWHSDFVLRIYIIQKACAPKCVSRLLLLTIVFVIYFMHKIVDNIGYSVGFCFPAFVRA